MSYPGSSPPSDPTTLKAQRISPLYGAVTEEATKLIGTNFAGSLTATGTTADNFWSVTRGTAVLSSGVVTLTGGTTNADWCQLASVRKARFIAGTTNFFRAMVAFSSVSAANTTTYIGNITTTASAPQNGYCFAVSGTGVISVQSYASAAAVLNASSGFNGTLGTTYSVPDTSQHIYEILYLASGAYFYIDGQLLHRALVTTVMFSPVDMSNAAGVAILNSTSPISRVVTVGLCTVTRYGQNASRPKAVFIPTTNASVLLKTGSGTLHRIIVGLTVNAATLAIYDGLTAGGTQLALLTSGAGNLLPYSIEFDIDFYTGLFIAASGTNAATTVVYD